MQPLKGEENVLCSVQVWFLAGEDLRTAAPERGGLVSRPAPLVNHCRPAPLCWDMQGLQIQKKREKGFSNRFYLLDWLCRQNKDAALCVGCQKVMPVHQTSYLLTLHPFLLLFASHLPYITPNSKAPSSIQSTASMFHDINLLTQQG